MTLKRNILPEKLEPYRGIIYFVIILLVSHYFWRFTVRGDDSDIKATFIGLDITSIFSYMSSHLTHTIANILHYFGSDIILQDNGSLFYKGGHGVHIIFSCTGIKQIYMFICIIGLTRGSWKNKAWFIPLGIVIIYLFNLFRLLVITIIVKNHFEWFDFFHEHLFKYLFYGLIFLMWVFWEEKFGVKRIIQEAETKI